MSFFKTLAGGTIGFLVGGPAGAVAGASIGSSLDAAGAQSKAAGQAADASVAAQDRAIALQRDMFNRQVELQEPWRQAGITALNRLTPLATQYTPFGMQQFQQDPGYQFRMSEGMKALERGAAARGGLLSGNTLRATQRFGQDLASQEYQNAFNRFQAERTAQLQPLQSLAGVGQTTAQGIAGQAGQMGANIGNLYASQGRDVGNALLASGQARASSYGAIGNVLGQMSGGGGFGNIGTAFRYGTMPGSQQTNMLAAQTAGMF
jgi:hypothetical protein